GFPGANAKCRAEFPDSFFCSYGDYSRAEPGAGAPAGGAWVDYERTSAGVRASSPCNNGLGSWTYAGTADIADYVNTTGGTVGSNCNIARALTCRTPIKRVFRGFTATSYLGDLGGFPGANAKCRAEFPGSFFCSYSDYTRSEPSVGGPATGAWVDYERTSAGVRATSPCNNGLGSWTYSGNADIADYVNTYGGTVGSNCNVPRQLACCQGY
ncbi:MAG: hypothetical protein IAE78_02160, partial [Myxococcus sp.]|nr:hypothetical protein [Myxococcus sp.]